MPGTTEHIQFYLTPTSEHWCYKSTVPTVGILQHSKTSVCVYVFQLCKHEVNGIKHKAFQSWVGGESIKRFKVGSTRQKLEMPDELLGVTAITPTLKKNWLQPRRCQAVSCRLLCGAAPAPSRWKLALALEPAAAGQPSKSFFRLQIWICSTFGPVSLFLFILLTRRKRCKTVVSHLVDFFVAYNKSIFPFSGIVRAMTAPALWLRITNHSSALLRK